MNTVNSKVQLYDARGNLITPSEVIRSGRIKKNAVGLYGNPNGANNLSTYHNRTYTVSDTESSVDQASRIDLVRWSRELTAQQPFIECAINLLADHSVGDGYNPVYTGNDSKWGKIAIDWLQQEFYPNCCTRGEACDFQTVLYLLSKTIDVDGDVLMLYGKNKFNLPQFQLIPTHRIANASFGTNVISEGKYAGSICADGVIYSSDGAVLGYNVMNANNLVNQSYASAETQISAKDCRLIYTSRFFDKQRGLPSIGSAILQGLSIQEIDALLVQKIRIQSSVALIEQNQSGEAPDELRESLAALEAVGQNGVGGFAQTTAGIRLVQGSGIRYIKAEGGELKTLDGNAPGSDTANYVKRLERFVLGAIGVPHALLFSQGDVSGRMISSIVETFRGTIDKRQKLLDKQAKLILSWALANAMEMELIPKNSTENITKIIELTHPKEFTLDPAYDRQSDQLDYESGIKSLNDIVSKDHKTAEGVIKERADEATIFFNEANRVSKDTGTDVNTVVAYLKSTMKLNIQSSLAIEPIAASEPIVNNNL